MSVLKSYRKKDQYSPYQELDTFTENAAPSIANENENIRMLIRQGEADEETLSSGANPVTFTNQHASTVMEEEIQETEP